MLDEPKKRYSRKREQRKIKFDILNAFADKLNLPHTWEWSRSPHIEPPNFLSTEDVRRFYERACPEPYDDKEKLKELKKAIINSYEKSKTFSHRPVERRPGPQPVRHASNGSGGGRMF